MKYFFLTEGWDIGRVWELGGLWNDVAWRRQPDIQRMELYIQDNQQEKLWLYSVEDAVLMVEVRPQSSNASDSSQSAIGQVVLKRLISAEQVLELLCANTVLKIGLNKETHSDTMHEMTQG